MCNGSQVIRFRSATWLESLAPASNRYKRRPPEAKKKETGKEKGSNKIISPPECTFTYLLTYLPPYCLGIVT